MIIAALLMGTFVLEPTPNSSPEKLFTLRAHMIAGIAILVLTIMRFLVRVRTLKPEPATIGNPVLDRLAVLTHYGLYILVVLMAASGIATSAMAGLPDIVFGRSGAPLPESFSVFPPRVAHGVLAKLLMAFVALHIFAALYHQFVRRDGLIRRMWFGSR
jgi:cytochrome b561